MAGLASKKIKDSYKSLIRVDDDTNGLDGSLANITDGGGNTAPFQMSQTAVEFAGGTSLTLGASTAFNTRQVNAPSGTLGLLIDFSPSDTGLSKIKLGDNLADALNITEDTNSYLKFITTNGSEKIVLGKDVEITGDLTANNILGDINFDSNTLFIDESENRVGIGLNNPATTLDVSGNVTITSTGVADAPSLAIDNSSNSSYIHSAEILAANLGTGNNNIVVIGKTGVTKKSGWMGYKLVEDSGSNNNLLVFGHYGTTELMTINGAGQIGMGSSTPGKVNGTDRTGGGDTGILHLQGTVPRIIFDDNVDLPQFAVTAQDFFTVDKIPDDSSSESQLLKIQSDGRVIIPQGTLEVGEHGVAGGQLVSDGNLTYNSAFNDSSGDNGDHVFKVHSGGTEIVRFNHDGKVGINSSSPSEELEIFSASGGNDVGIKLRALGTSSTAESHVPAISLQSDQGDGVTARASISADRDGGATKGKLIFKTRVSDNITTVMSLDSSGNQKLHNNGLRITMDSDTENANGSSLQRGTLFLNRDDTATIKQLSFYKAGSEHSYLETSKDGLEIGGSNTTFSGDVLISKNDAKLTVFASNTGDKEAIVIDRNTASNGDSQEIRWKLQGSNYPGGYILHEFVDANNSRFAFGTRQSGTPATALLIDESGNVTVGGSATAQRSLHVQGSDGICISDGDRDRVGLIPLAPDANTGGLDINVRSGGSSTFAVRVENTGKVGIGDQNPEGQLTIQQGTNDYFGISLKSSSDVDHGMTNLAETDTYGSISKVASDHGGFMAVGYTQESIGLQFVADVTTQLSGQSTSSSGAIDIIAQLKSGVSATTLDADKNLATIKNGSTTRFIFNSNGTGYADDSFSTFSDERLKKDIKEIPYGLDEINKLQPKIFTKHSGDFDNDGNVILEDNGKRKIGFIAQEIKKVIPEMITNPNEDLTKGFYALDDGKLTSVLVRAVQELSAKVTELEKKLGE